MPELVFPRLHNSFEALESPLEDVLVTFRVESLLEEIRMASLSSVKLLFPLLSPQCILDLEPQHVINAFFPVVDIRPYAVIVEKRTQVDLALSLLAEVQVLAGLQNDIE